MHEIRIYYNHSPPISRFTNGDKNYIKTYPLRKNQIKAIMSKIKKIKKNDKN